MAELISQDRLQPSLLDRLSDDDTSTNQESRDKRVLSMRGLRRAVLRDLGWLFNSSGLDALQSLAEYPLAAQSLLNFGIPDLTGQTASGLDLTQLERVIQQAIWDFEPRILRDTLRVNAFFSQVESAGESRIKPNQIVFEVHGELWGQPLPERLYLKTELDLEVGQIKVYDHDARPA
ncbi:MAG: type VI secretion system baseplate subunit TssE [Pseudomonadota bacterium]